MVLIGALGTLLLVDFAIAEGSQGFGAGGPTLAWLAPLSGIVTAAAVVAGRHRRLEPATAVAVVCSLTISYIAPGNAVNPSVTDVFGLLVLTSLTIRSVARPAATFYLAGLGAALLGNAVRREWYGNGSLVFAVTMAFAVAVGVGAYLRWLDVQRIRAASDARRDERLDLARELHDLVAHYVTGIVVQAQAAQVVAEQKPRAAQDALGQIERAGTDALAAMRRMVGSLRSEGDPAASDGEGDALTPAGSAGLEDLIDQHNRLGVPARLHLHDVDPDALPPAVGASVHRIVLESLTNIRRHGVDVTTVDVTVARRGGTVELVVRDDGSEVLRRPGRVGGFGLVGMTERAVALGGILTAGPVGSGGSAGGDGGSVGGDSSGGSSAGGGWQVRASLPIDDPKGHRSRSASCWPTTRRWCGPASSSSSKPRTTSPWSPRPATGSPRSTSPGSTGPTSASSTSACPGSTGSRPPGCWPAGTWRNPSPWWW